MSHKSIDLDNLIDQGNKVFAEFLQYDRHRTQLNSITDLSRVEGLINKFDELYKAIPDINISDEKSLYVRELKRMCKFHVSLLAEEFTSEITTPEAIIERYHVKDEDITALKDWLLSNKQEILAANNRQYEYYSSVERSSIRMGSLELVTTAENLLRDYVEAIKTTLLKNVSHLSIGEVLKDYIITFDRVNGRSAANRIAKYAILGIDPCVYMNKGTIYLLEEEVISKFGHEVLGHTANFYATAVSDMPLFIKENYFQNSTSSRESVTNYFESRIFDFLTGLDEFRSKSNFEGLLTDVVSRYHDTRILEDYNWKLRMVGYWVLCKTKMEDFDKQVKELNIYSIEPQWPPYFLAGYRNDWNKATGLIMPRIAAELRYSVDAVGKLLAEKKPTDLAKFEQAILVGAWSPQGFEEWVKMTGY